jgi:type VI secretion system protein ImpF
MNPRTETPLTPSLLDRLTDEQPGVSRDSYLGPWEQQRQVRAAIRRDLTTLLNIRRTDDIPSEFEQVRASLLTMGILDYTSLNLMNPENQELLRRSIERAIRQFEPRLTRVSVALEIPESRLLTLRFRIDAMQRTHSSPVPMYLDAVVRADTRRFEVTGEGE